MSPAWYKIVRLERSAENRDRSFDPLLRQSLSADRFDNIPYTAIAPTMHLSSTFTSSFQAVIEDLGFAARGCQ
jgi:hypothetical protein